MRRAIASLAVLLSACATGADSAQPQTETPVLELARDPAVTRVAAEMPAGDYVLDPRHTSVLWRVRHWGLSPYTGRFDTISGTLSFDTANPAQSSVSVRIPVASVSTGLLNREGERAWDREIADALGAATHADITFVSQSVEVTSPTSGRIHGVLSLNGQSHPATLETVFEGGRVIPTSQRPTVAFSARTIIRRSQWLTGTHPLHSHASPGDEVEIIINAEFVRRTA